MAADREANGPNVGPPLILACHWQRQFRVHPASRESSATRDRIWWNAHRLSLLIGSTWEARCFVETHPNPPRGKKLDSDSARQ